LLKQENDEEHSMKYVERVLSKTCANDSVLKEVADEQLQEMIDAFQCYTKIIRYMTEAKVGLSLLLNGDMMETIAGFRQFPQKKIKQ